MLGSVFLKSFELQQHLLTSRRSNVFDISLTPVININWRISPRIFEKIRNGPNGLLRGPGAVLWNRNCFLRFRFLLLKSYGSCSGSSSISIP